MGIMPIKNKHPVRNTNNDKVKKIKVAILAEEPIGWRSNKYYFPRILNGYSWNNGNYSYEIFTTYIFDKDILQGKLNVSDYDVLLVPGGGVGDGEAIVKGFSRLRKVRKWKENISRFIKDGGGYVGICGGAVLITGLNNESNKTPKTFTERQYNKSSLGISCVTSYYKDLAIPILYPFQRKHPEKIGASSYVFSFAPGTTADGAKIYTGGVPIDFKICNDNSIFSGFSKEKERMRWWGGPALLVPKNPDRNVKILARYPKEELSENDSTKIRAWIYTGGIRGLFLALLKAFRIVKKEKASLKNVLFYAYFLAGDWKPTDRIIDLNYSNKPCMTAEIYPNENKGRIFLCSAHPQYMIWWGGQIEEVDDSGFNCLANGLHRWKNISPLSKNGEGEVTHTWWIVRRCVAWAAKVPDKHLPPIDNGRITKENRSILSGIFCDDSLINQMKNI